MNSKIESFMHLKRFFPADFVTLLSKDSFLYRLLVEQRPEADVWRRNIDDCLELAYRYNLVDADLEARLKKGDWESWEAAINELKVAKSIEQIIGDNCLNWRPIGKKRRVGEFEILLDELKINIFCEVKTILPRDLERLEQHVYDKLRSCIKEVALPFAITIQLKNAGEIENFSERSLKIFLEDELKRLDTQDKEKVYELPDYQDKTGLHLEIHASPSKKFNNCYLGACSFNARWGSNEAYVKHSLGKAYTKLDGTKPSLVILCASPNYLINEHDMLGAWLGTENVVITYGEDGAAINTEVTRKPNGFCLKRPKISAASIYKDNIDNEQAEIVYYLEIYHNPLATIPIDESIFKGHGVKQLIRKNDREMEWIN